MLRLAQNMDRFLKRSKNLYRLTELRSQVFLMPSHRVALIGFSVHNGGTRRAGTACNCVLHWCEVAEPAHA
jgi:hypothetical protein